MKRIVWIVTAVLLLFAAGTFPVSADAAGWVLHSDITAYINGRAIPSYNIDGYTYVAAEDLAGSGFSVSYRPQRIVKIFEYGEEITLQYEPVPSSRKSGSRACPYEAARDLVILGGNSGEPTKAVTIEGRLCIPLDDLARYYAAEYVWDPQARQICMTVHEDGKPRIPSWTYTYVTPGYDKDTPVDGTYAIWEFAKNEAGEFILTYSEGDTLFTPQISFGSTEMSYRIDVKDVPVTNAGRTEPYSASHTLAAHDEIYWDIMGNTDDGTLFFGRPYAADGRELYPERFRYYAYEMPEYARQLLEAAGDLPDIWRVYYNGEKLTGIGIQEPRIIHFTKFKTFEDFRFLYDRYYPLEEIQTVRIELQIPGDGTK